MVAKTPKRKQGSVESGKQRAPAKGTLILRVTMHQNSKVRRDIEVEAARSLHHLAEAIVDAFDFDFDHAFGFYSGKTRRTLMHALPKYELFADLEEPVDGALGVKRTKIASAFPETGHVMTFLFDYGDDWMFRVKLVATGEKLATKHYPNVLESVGTAPEQYPAEEDL